MAADAAQAAIENTVVVAVRHDPDAVVKYCCELLLKKVTVF